MTIRLSIENIDRLPDGGPMRVEFGARGFDVGRDAHLDWVLPDPSRFISGKHCEVRFRDGGYWLHDVSTNGTFLNDSQFRMTEPHLLRDGDRLVIGSYVVKVEIRGALGAQGASAPIAAQSAFSSEPAPGADLWGAAAEAAAPEDRRAFKGAGSARPGPDFLDYAASVRPEDPMAPAFAPPRAENDAWISAPAPAFAPVPEPIVTPTPRRGPRFASPPPDAWASSPPQPTPPAPPPFPAPTSPAAPVVAERTSPPPLPPAASTSEAAAASPAPVAWGEEPPPIPSPRAIETPSPAPSPTIPSASTPRAPSPGDADLLARLLAAAGVPARAVADRDPIALVEEIGAALRLSVDNLAHVLGARAESKSLMRSSSRTMIRAMENNPLKFSPTTEEALAIMFGPPSRAYLDAKATIAQGFSDIKSHQMLTLEATRAAVDELFEDLAPPSIDKSVEPERGLGSLVASRKAKLWDVFVERWRAKTKRADGRLNEAFAELFARAYDRLQNK